MFEKLETTILVQVGGGYKETTVHSQDDELFLKHGSYMLRIKNHGRTSNPKVTWIKFSDDYQPAFNKIGWAVVKKVKTRAKAKKKSN